MEVYVSENEIPKNCANCKQFNNYTCGLDKEDKNMKFMTQAPVEKNEYCQIKSIEQHDRELLEQLFEKAKKLVICEDEYATISIYGLKSIINELLKERGV